MKKGGAFLIWSSCNMNTRRTRPDAIDDRGKERSLETLCRPVLMRQRVGKKEADGNNGGEGVPERREL